MDFTLSTFPILLIYDFIIYNKGLNSMSVRSYQSLALLPHSLLFIYCAITPFFMSVYYYRINYSLYHAYYCYFTTFVTYFFLLLSYLMLFAFVILILSFHYLQQI